MELLISKKSNMLRLAVTGLKPLFWLFLILTTLNLSTGAVIVLVESGPDGESLDNDSNTTLVGEVRLLHLELFGGIIHFHPTIPSTATSTGLNLNVIENEAVVQSFDMLFPYFAATAVEPNPGFSHANQLAASEEKPDPAGLKKGDKVISSSSSEPGLSRVFSPNFQDPEKSVISVQLAAIFHQRAANPPEWTGIFSYPPEKPPRVPGLEIPA